MLKSHKFFVLKIQKQLQMNYMEGKININSNFNDGKKHKKKVIKIKKIKKKE